MIHVYMISIQGEEDSVTIRSRYERQYDEHFSQTVIRRNALYLLPDQTIADVTQVLSWCFSCDHFTDGELIRTDAEFRDILTHCQQEVPRPYVSICRNQAMVDRFSKHIERCRNWRRHRTAPAKCLECGSTNITQFHQPPGESFVDPRGRKVVWEDRVVCTELDNQLFVYDENGTKLVVMSIHCPNTKRMIFDEFPPSEFVKLFNDAKHSRQNNV